MKLTVKDKFKIAMMTLLALLLMVFMLGVSVGIAYLFMEML